MIADDRLSPATPDEAEEELPSLSEAIRDQIGGVRGVVESSTPVLVFIIANNLVKTGLNTAIIASIASALLIALLRLLLKQSVRYALNGLFGVAIAALFAWYFGEARDFFLPGIIISYTEAAAFVAAVLFGHPVIGYGWALMSEKLEGWRRNRSLRRTFAALTLVWAAALSTNSTIQLVFYLQKETGSLATARLLGKILYVGALALTLFFGRRAVKQAYPKTDHLADALDPELARESMESGQA